ncbi:hypothetical protein BDZ45DRAFT_755314 [Acephala macrosclerotiorum]|nr:hypothetical protein BDZ45DRAFT_755314 [Acephala macrosclerotiorum]
MADKQDRDAKSLSTSSTSEDKQPKSTPDKTKPVPPTKNAEDVSPESLQQAVLTTFHLFSKLPTELQGITWSWAAPPASILKLGWDRDAQVPVHKGIIRAAPPMLGVCHESRELILKHSSIKNHPLLAGLFTFADEQGTRAREHFYFLTKLDTLWIPSDFLYHGLFNRHFTLDLADHLRHLATERHYVYDPNRKFFSLIHKSFPDLETLTIIITHPKMFLAAYEELPPDSTTQYQGFASKLGLEVDGEIDTGFNGVDPAWQVILGHERSMMLGLFEQMKTKHKDWKMPTLKFKDQSQFLQGRVVLNNTLAAYL